MTQRFKRHVYLNLKSLSEARSVFFKAFPGKGILGEEFVPTTQALDRITSRPVFSRYSSPNYHAAAMDGVAVRADLTYGARPDRPKSLVLQKEAFMVNTGHLLPAGTDAVIMIEQVQTMDGERIEIDKPAYPWQHVRKVGEDIVATEMLLPPGCVVGPYEMGALVAAGITRTPVLEKPRVAIIPTGSELVSAARLEEEPNLEPGQVVEFNSVLLSGLTLRSGAVPLVREIQPDDYEGIVTALKKAVDSDAHLVIINAGSSAGSEDYTANAIAELGQILVHGVSIMPGKPTILGEIKGKPVIGNPGYPVSAVISYEQFAAPYLARIQGLTEPRRHSAQVTPAQALPSKLGLEEFMRVKLGRIDERLVAVPLPRGAGSITTLTRADGIIRIAAESEGVGSAETATAELLRPLEDIEGALICIGSHDNTLDVLNGFLKKKNPKFSLSSGNVGSLGGLLTLKRGFSHLAGSHLLDTETGEYNISHIRKHLAGFPVRLVNLVTRRQGLIVLPGNPKNIKNFDDLIREGVTFINRQPGSGTRILLDYQLKERNLDAEGIRGYENEEFTHMAVAAAVQSGRADAGLAIFAAAKALGLGFVPVTTERYDLVIAEKSWDDEKIQTLLDVIRSEEFKTAVLELGGYGVERTGQLLWTFDGKE